MANLFSLIMSSDLSKSFVGEQSSVSSGKNWQRASGRYDMKAMPLSEGLPLSPSTLQIAAIDDSDPGRCHTTSKEDDDFLHDVDAPDRG